MSLISSWQNWVTPDGGRVAAWFDSPGEMTMVINGESYTGSTSSSPGNICHCNFSGLDSDSAYTAELFLDGVSQGTRTVWTQRTIGPVRGLWLSCVDPSADIALAFKWARHWQPDIAFWVGDMVYHGDGPETLYGVTRNNPESSYAEAIATDAEAWNSVRFFALRPGFKRLASICPVLLSDDDHESLSDWRNDLSGMQAQFAWLDSQEKLDAIKTARFEIVDDFIFAGTDRYYTLQYGPVTFIKPDLVKEKGALDSFAMMSAEQLAWYKAQLSAAETPFIIGVHGKTCTDGNADSWFRYGGGGDAWADGSQIRNIMEHIDDNEIATIGFLTGDLHQPHVQYQPTPSGGAETEYSPYLGICACAESQFFSFGATTDDIIWKPHNQHTVGLFEVSETKVDYYVANYIRQDLWFGRQEAGANTLVYPRARDRRIAA